MPFRTHTEGGSWLGGGRVVQNCIPTSQDAITNAFNFLRNTILPRISSFGGLGSLASCLSGKTVASVDIDCGGPLCQGSAFGRATRGGNEITLCNPALANVLTLDVTVFHELVHSCGGTEIDSWALENHFYVGHGTMDPGSGQCPIFRSQTSDIGGGLRAGTFVVWNPSEGSVFAKIETGGGGWLSSSRITPGTTPINVINTTSAYTC